MRAVASNTQRREEVKVFKVMYTYKTKGFCWVPAKSKLEAMNRVKNHEVDDFGEMEEVVDMKVVSATETPLE